MTYFDTPLTRLATHYIMVLLPNNMEGRNGRFNYGGHCESNGLDASKTHPTQEPRLLVRFQASRREDRRAVSRGCQQVAGDVNRTVQNSTTRQNIEVSVLATAPRLLPVLVEGASSNLEPMLPIAIITRRDRSVKSRGVLFYRNR